MNEKWLEEWLKIVFYIAVFDVSGHMIYLFMIIQRYGEACIFESNPFVWAFEMLIFIFMLVFSLSEFLKELKKMKKIKNQAMSGATSVPS